MKISLPPTSIPFRTLLIGVAFASLTLGGCDSKDSGSHSSQKDEVATTASESGSKDKEGGKKKKKKKTKKTDTAEGDNETPKKGGDGNSRAEDRLARFENRPKLNESLRETAAYGTPKNLEELLDMGAMLEFKDSNGRTPLYCAVREGNMPNVKFLLKQGANVNTKMDGGDTPLHSAAIHGHTQIASLLLEKGANLDAKNSSGETPLRRAVDKGELEM